MTELETSSCFFTRGSGPLVSVLIPSRGDPESLDRCIRSCVNKAKYPKTIEFLIRADLDDKPTIDCVKELSQDCGIVSNILCQIGPRGKGYMDIHNFLNGLAAQAKGDWLFIMNDDAVVETENWDIDLLYSVLRGCWLPCPHETMVMWPRTFGNDDAFLGYQDFFFLRRKTYEIMGCVCESPYGDAWLKHVTQLVGATADFYQVSVKHLRNADRERDRNGKHLEASATLYSSFAGLSKIAAASKLLSYIERFDAARFWYTGPIGPGWYRWRRSFDDDPFFAYVNEHGACLLFGEGEATPTSFDIGGLWQPR